MMKSWGQIFDKILMPASSRESLDQPKQVVLEDIPKNIHSIKNTPAAWIHRLARHKDVTLAQEIHTMVVFTIGHVLRGTRLG